MKVSIGDNSEMGPETVGILHRGGLQIHFISVNDNAQDEDYAIILWDTEHIVIALKEDYLMKGMVMDVNRELLKEFIDPTQVDPEYFMRRASEITAEWLSFHYELAAATHEHPGETSFDRSIALLLKEEDAS